MINWLLDMDALTRYGLLVALGVLGCLGMWGVLRLAAWAGEQAPAPMREAYAPARQPELRAARNARTWRRYAHRGRHRPARWWHQLTSGLTSWDH